MDSSIKYRPDVDGLRAVAVVSVVANHFLIPGFHGGFVGVDIFFVISGYLITRIIIAELSSGGFSLARFYDRRARRILPALFLMMLASLIAGALLLYPDDWVFLAKSSLWTMAFASNLFFARNLGSYFSSAADLQPLLHTWSLAVEEQFYVIFPLLLIVTWRFGKRPVIIIVACISAVSLAAAILTTAASPIAAFYLPFSRVWELGMGVLLALGALSVKRVSIGVQEASAAAGLLLIGLSILLVDKNTAFPGWWTLAPCAGAAALIWTSEYRTTNIGRLLSARLVVYIGRISYSLYLWHWPVRAFALHWNDGPLNPWQSAAAIVLSFLLAAISFTFVETPFRRGAGLKGFRIFAATGATAIVMTCLALPVIAFHGVPQRGGVAPEWVALMQSESAAFQKSECLGRSETVPAITRCAFGTVPYSVVLWGDSHAAHLAPVMDRLGAKHPIGWRQITKAGCPPILEVRITPASEMTVGCEQFNAAAIAEIESASSVKIVVLAAMWAPYLTGQSVLTTDQGSGASALSAGIMAIKDRLGAKGIDVLVVGNAPHPDLDAVECVARASFLRLQADHCFAADTEKIAAAERAVVAAIGPDYFALWPWFCSAESCNFRLPGGSVFMDASHFSAAGLRVFEGKLVAAILNAMRSS